MAFRLRYQAHDLKLPVGDFVIGRATECQLAVDDALVSRRHAVLRVTSETVTAEDLGSRNGVIVNGRKIRGKTRLEHEDTLRIGSHSMVLIEVGKPNNPAATKRARDIERLATQTLSGADAEALQRALQEPDRGSNASLPDVAKLHTSLSLLSGLAAKCMSMGRYDEAEKIARLPLLDLLQDVDKGLEFDADLGKVAGGLSAKLASAGQDGEWIDYAIRLYSAWRRPMPAAIIDELYGAIRHVDAVDVHAIRSYIGRLREKTTWSPADRFLIQRLEGLERLASLR